MIKQQYIYFHQSVRINEYPYDAIIKDSIKTIKTKQKDNHEIIVAMDGNEPSTSAKGGITKLCQNLHLYDLMDYQHGKNMKFKYYIRESQKIGFIFCSQNILKLIHRCGMTGFGEHT